MIEDQDDTFNKHRIALLEGIESNLVQQIDKGQYGGALKEHLGVGVDPSLWKWKHRTIKLLRILRSLEVSHQIIHLVRTNALGALQSTLR